MKRCEHKRLETGYVKADKLVCLDCGKEWIWQPLKKRYVLDEKTEGGRK